MKPFYKRVLYLDLEAQTYEYKIHADLWKYLGGVGIAYKLYADSAEDTTAILACGPLNGYFPYVSKACLLHEFDGTVVERYGGGSVGAKMNFASVDAIVFVGKPKTNLSITVYEEQVTFTRVEDQKGVFAKPDFSITKSGIYSLDYHSFLSASSAQPIYSKGVWLNIEANDSTELENFYDYENLYKKSLELYQSVSVEPRNNPSCIGCPLGCDNSHLGEDDLNIGVIPRSLVSCGYAEEIYKDIPFVYACLSSLGYRYRHEDIEVLPALVGDLKANIVKGGEIDGNSS